VVDRLEQPLRVTLGPGHLGGRGNESGQVRTVVPAPVDQGVPGVAVRGDGGPADSAVLVGDVVRLLQYDGALRARVGDALVHVRDLEGEVGHAVAVPAVVVEQRALRADPAGDDEARRTGLEHERLVVLVTGLRAGVRDQVHAEGELVVLRGLGGVADHEHHGVHRGDGERVGALVVRHQADELLQLVEVEIGVELRGGEVGAGHRGSSRWGTCR
jgi:hypothetical protein